MATSHAYTFLAPEEWDRRRRITQANFEKRYGRPVGDRPEVAGEDLADCRERYAAIRRAHDGLRERIGRLAPDTIVLVGDDQDENLTEANLPQFAVYVGDDFDATDRASGHTMSCRSDAALARALVTAAVEEDFDVASMSAFEGGMLRSHAHTEPLVHLLGGIDAAVVPVFVNAIHVPAPRPARCHAFGRLLRRAIDAAETGGRVVVIASGGMSHFTAGYPWPHYEGPATVGSINVSFDADLVDRMRSGRGSDLCGLRSRDLLENGGVEFRQWLVLLGAVGDVAPTELVYQPFYRAVMGMAVGHWDLAAPPGRST